MTTITILSNEVLDIILQQEIISIKDVVNFGLTCKRFLNMICNNKTLWQTKFYQRWPHLKRFYDKRIQNKEYVNFEDDVKTSIKCTNTLRRHLSLMSARLFEKDNLSESDMQLDILYHSYNDVCIKNHYFFKDEMIRLITTSPLLPDCNLTYKYYSKELLLYLQQRYLKDVWQQFINCPIKHQLLEKAALIVAQWYQPQKHIFYFDMEASLDDIAQQVLDRLKEAHPKHPIFSTSAKQFSVWKYNNINYNQWNKNEERQIINMLRIVLFDELGFCGSSVSEHYVYKLEDILIDCVLENKVGDAVSLAIIFHSVARRLGVPCDLVSFPTHFFLSWKPKSITDKDEEHFYIDILHGGTIVNKNNCPRTRGRQCPIESFNRHNNISATEVVLRMIYHLQMVNPNYQHYQDRTLQIRSLIEFRYLIEPYDIDVIRALGNHYMRNHMNLSNLLDVVERMLKDADSISPITLMLQSASAIAMKRVRDTFKMYMQNEDQHSFKDFKAPMYVEYPKIRYRIKYAVGMIVTRKSTPKFTGVIIGWNKTYNRQYLNNPKVKVINVPNSPTQPFYIVLSEDGNKYYDAEDSLIQTYPPRWIEHKEIGRYFCRFAESYYVPNEVLTSIYTNDEHVLRRRCRPTYSR